MPTVLKNVLRFTGLVAGVPQSLPHGFNYNGRALRPHLVLPQSSGFTVTADATNVTVTRVLGGAAVDVYAELWHTYEDAEPAGGISTSVLPFVLDQGNSSSAGNPQRFSYTATGVEADRQNLVIALPAARGNATYLVQVSQEQASFELAMNVQTASKTINQFVLSLSAISTAGDKFVFTVADPT